MRRPDLPLSLVLAVTIAGCTSRSGTPAKSTSAPQTSPSVGESTAQVAPTGPTATPERHKSRKLVDDSMTAGARGLQPITFAVTSFNKTVEGATITIHTAQGKPAGSGISNDWGEFQTSLAPGRYTVAVEWQGHTTKQSIHIDTNSEEIPLSLSSPDS